jgi:hypothetical protein
MTIEITIHPRRPIFNAISLPIIEAGTDKILTIAAADAADTHVTVPAGSEAALKIKKATIQVREPNNSVQ